MFRLRISEYSVRKAVVVSFLAVIVQTQGVAYGHNGLHEQIEKVTELLQEEGADALLYVRRAELYRLHRDFDEALADLERARSLDPDLSAVDSVLGNVFYDTGYYAAAEVVLTRCLNINDSDGQVFLLRARARGKLGDVKSASEDYEHALELLNEVKPDYYLEYADLYAGKEGDGEKALAVLDAGIRRLGQVVTLELKAIEIDRLTGKYDKAVKRADALAAQTQRPERYYKLKGDIYLQADRYQDAVREYEKAADSIRALPVRLRHTGSVRKLRHELDEALHTAREKEAETAGSDREEIDADG